MSEVQFSVTDAKGDITAVRGKGISVAKGEGGRRVLKFNPGGPGTEVTVYLTARQAAFMHGALAYTCEATA